jgi:dihydroorotate dehydrogenase electron transfer subunit
MTRARAIESTAVRRPPQARAIPAASHAPHAHAAAPPPRWRQASATVAHHVDYGAGHRWLDLDVPAPFEAPEPGQFVELLLLPPSPVVLPRPMSVAAVSGQGGGFRLGFLYAAVGSGTRALAALPAGAAVDVLGPLGHGFPLARPGTPVLIAGGRGVAPMIFAAEALARAGRRCEFLFGARDRARLVGFERAREQLAAMGGRLHLATDDGSEGHAGDVVSLLDGLAPGFGAPLVIHACGPHAMLGAVAGWGARNGVEAHVAMESVMACGTGVCRGCPLPRSAARRAAFREAETPSLLGNREFAMCCTEGPVFEARTLDWDRVE